MKTFSFFISLLFLQALSAQTDTTFFNAGSVISSKQEATFYRIYTQQNEIYLVKQFNMKTNALQMQAICSSYDPLIKNGKVTYYFETGKKRSEGKYVNNTKEGNWTIWNENEPDSSLVECYRDGTYKNIFVSAKNKTANKKLDTLYPVNVFPQFPGGERQMQIFIAKNMKFPKVEMEAGISGKCYVAFTIEKDGSLTDIRILERGIMNTVNYNNEALRLVGIMPKWTPATEFGRPISLRMYAPIVFEIKKKTETQIREVH